MSRETPVPMHFEGEDLEHVLVSRRDGATRPAVLLIPTVMGVSELELAIARQLVELGFSGLVVDLFGKAFREAPRDVMFAEMARLKCDRGALRRRLLAVLEQARGLSEIETDSIVVAGYCFGGMCALDVARSGAEVAAAVAFHGLFDAPDLPPGKIATKVVAFHGWDDPLVPPEKVTALAQELTGAGADWQIHAYGHVVHGFTNPKATGAMAGIEYNALAAERAWTSFINLLEELFGADG